MIFVGIMLSCSLGETSKTATEVDSSMYFNKDIKYGDSLSSLIAKGAVTPNIDSEHKPLLMDRSYLGVVFDEAYLFVMNDKAVGLWYCAKSSNKDSIQSKFNKLNTALYKSVGKPIQDSSYVDKDNRLPMKVVGRYYVWATKYQEITINPAVYDWLLDSDEYFLNVYVDIKKEVIKANKQ